MLKLSDIPALILTVGLAVFFIIPESRMWYESAYAVLPLLVTFIKFALLASAGEMLVQRIRGGSYLPREFGLLPKMLIWGLIGMTIYWIFGIFSSGVRTVFPAAFELSPVLGAFLISLFMNVIFAPVMMLFHNLSDRFIAEHNGKLPFWKWNTRDLLEKTDWQRMWGFVFKKTIPFFWIPAHTITFLLPVNYRTLFAALLSVALGLLLAIAAGKKNTDTEAAA